MTSTARGSLTMAIGAALVIGTVSYFVWRYQSNQSSKGIDRKKKGNAERAVEEEPILEETLLLFQKATEVAKTLTGVSNGDKLFMYGLYKQATVGECPNKAAPSSLLRPVEHAKWKSWTDAHGISKRDAMSAYIEVIQRLEIGEEITQDDDFGPDSSLGLRPSMPVHEDENDDEAGDASTSLEAQLRKAAREKDWEQVRSLMDRGVDVNGADDSGQTALHFCADRGELEGVQILLETANVNAIDSDGISVLLAAVIAEHVEVARLLLERGAQPDLADIDGDTPRSAAMDHGSKEMQALFQ